MTDTVALFVVKGALYCSDRFFNGQIDTQFFRSIVSVVLNDTQNISYINYTIYT